MSVDDLYERGCDLDEHAPQEAAQAYRDALELDPDHADAHVNLGRILHDQGDPRAAIEHYRKALELAPRHATASFNLGVALEDLRLFEEAVLAYTMAIATDPACADAHYNLSRLYERRGEGAAALRHLRTYRNLVERS
jgi:tetratricopeptide (TPR) repeat protein